MRDGHAGFMLHSDRSFPGTPDWPGSRTGTGPGGGQKEKQVSDQPINQTFIHKAPFKQRQMLFTPMVE